MVEIQKKSESWDGLHLKQDDRDRFFYGPRLSAGCPEARRLSDGDKRFGGEEPSTPNLFAHTF
jgi:hypothetical protein